MSKIFSTGTITRINKETLEVHLEDNNVILALIYNPKKLYKQEYIEVGYKVYFLYDTITREILRLDVIKKSVLEHWYTLGGFN